MVNKVFFNNLYKIRYIILLLFLGYFIWSLIDFHFYYPNRRKSLLLKEFYRGIVTNKYIDTENHNYEKVILDEKKIILLPSAANFLYDTLRVGDVLFKEKNSIKGYVIRENDTIFSYYITKPEFLPESLKK